jgi:hypothetical protein
VLSCSDANLPEFINAGRRNAANPSTIELALSAPARYASGARIARRIDSDAPYSDIELCLNVVQVLNCRGSELLDGRSVKYASVPLALRGFGTGVSKRKRFEDLIPESTHDHRKPLRLGKSDVYACVSVFHPDP